MRHDLDERSRPTTPPAGAGDAPVMPPARDLRCGIVYDVVEVLARYGLDAKPLHVLMALYEVLRQTSTSRGGRAADPVPAPAGGTT